MPNSGISSVLITDLKQDYVNVFLAWEMDVPDGYGWSKLLKIYLVMHLLGPLYSWIAKSYPATMENSAHLQPNKNVKVDQISSLEHIQSQVM